MRLPHVQGWVDPYQERVSQGAGRTASAAKDKGVLIEPGDVFFADAPTPRPLFRLGFLSIPAQKIDDGIAKLADVMRSMDKATRS